ncbi:hypothetical protein HYW75_06260 [Candidatus Pacearchaeota archaeon]|nr:hypothetical protein [Candidatus Pacearchaeota archaeon]
MFELVHFFRKDFNVPVILKNVGLEEVAGLKNYGFSEYTSDEFWNEDCKYDDQTFPQRIFKIEDLLALKGHKYASLRRKLRRCVDIETRLYSNEHDFKYVRQLLQKQDEHMAGEVYASQRLFLSLPQTENTTSLVFLYNTRIVGFSLLDRISSKCAGLNGLIYDSSIRELSAHIVFESVSSAFTSGYSYINLQGSEYPGLDFWKRMFNPEISIEKIHLIYR